MEAILKAALKAHDRAALARWEKDGRKDCGACGGFMARYRGNTKIAKAMLAAGVGYEDGGGVYLLAPLPAEIRSQHRMIAIEAGQAFVAAVEELAGVKPTRAWSYVD